MALAHMNQRRFHPRQVAAKIGKLLTGRTRQYIYTHLCPERQRIVGGRTWLALLGRRSHEGAQSARAVDHALIAQNPKSLADGFARQAVFVAQGRKGWQLAVYGPIAAANLFAK